MVHFSSVLCVSLQVHVQENKTDFFHMLAKKRSNVVSFHRNDLPTSAAIFPIGGHSVT